MNKDKYDKMDPLSITESLGIKTFRKTSRNIWSVEEDHQLTEYLMYVTSQPLNQIDSETIDWDLLASRLSKDGIRKPKDYKKRWTTSLDPNVKKGKWTLEEDEQLIQAYKKYGASWQKVAASIRTRTMDQCAKRYTEVLDPKTKDRLNPWTKEEELLLIKQVGIHGTKWRTVASNFKNRPALTCRNRWRKIVLSVVKDKADPFIKQEVERVTRELNSEFNEDNNMNMNMNMNMSNNGMSNNGISNNGMSNNGMSNSGMNNNGMSNNGMNHNSNNNNMNSSARVEPKITTEWKYSLLGGESLPVNGGIIKNEELVKNLITYAKHHNVKISIHQHMHHHYNPPPHPFNHINNNNLGFDMNLDNGFDFNQMQNPQSKSYFLEPEVQLQRFQHFNYLPPLTEVPKLTSSNKDKNSEKSPEDSLTPLTQAVHFAVDQELSKKRNRTASELESIDSMELPTRRHRKSNSDEEEEEGVDFWETMRNLGDIPPKADTKPVSQHHPLHHQTPTPGPTKDGAYREKSNSVSLPQFAQSPATTNNVMEVDNKSSTSSEQEHNFVYENLFGNFGVIPFNPS